MTSEWKATGTSGEAMLETAFLRRTLPLRTVAGPARDGGVGVRKELFELRGVISSSHVRFPAPPLDGRTLSELVAPLGLEG